MDGPVVSGWPNEARLIYLLVTRRAAQTFGDYLADWAGPLSPLLEVRTYEDFSRWPEDGPGTWVFSDLERLSVGQLTVVCDFAAHLQARHPSARLLNHPARALRRLGLLKALHAAGINQFRAFSLADLPEEVRFPVFLRMAREHRGPAGPLIGDAAGLRTAMLEVAMSGAPLEDVLAVEYCETRCPDGLYRKYSAFCLGEQTVPAHITFSSQWVAKDGNPTEDQIAEEAVFLQSHPHASLLRSVFDLACIDYGRVDYSLLDGRPQVWEINTNPILLKSRAYYAQHSPGELPAKDRLAHLLRECFQSINSGGLIHAVPGRRNVSEACVAELLRAARR